MVRIQFRDFVVIEMERFELSRGSDEDNYRRSVTTSGGYSGPQTIASMNLINALVPPEEKYNVCCK